MLQTIELPLDPDTHAVVEANGAVQLRGTYERCRAYAQDHNRRLARGGMPLKELAKQGAFVAPLDRLIAMSQGGGTTAYACRFEPGEREQAVESGTLAYRQALEAKAPVRE